MTTGIGYSRSYYERSGNADRQLRKEQVLPISGGSSEDDKGKRGAGKTRNKISRTGQWQPMVPGRGGVKDEMEVVFFKKLIVE